MAVGDFNADGKLDVVTNNHGGTASVLLGHGDGTFEAPGTVDLGSGSYGATPAGVATGDFNDDGTLDLAAATHVYYPGGGGYYGWYSGWWNGRMSILLGNGDGSFGTPSTATVSQFNKINSASVGDFNSDGHLDVATADTGYWWGDSHAVVALGDGTGALASVVHVPATSGGPADSVIAGDVNADGRADLVTTSIAEDTVRVLLGDGAGGFAPDAAYPTGAHPMAVDLAEFNGDGRVDIITANSVRGTVSVLLGAGGGTFHNAVSRPAGSNAVDVAVGDFDGDGRADVAAANVLPPAVSVLFNDGDWLADDAPSLRIDDVTVTEGNAGSANATFTVSLSAASPQTVAVRYATNDVSATVAAGDYVAASGTLTFAPGETSKTIDVAVNGDRAAEGTEVFQVRLSDAENAFVADATGDGTVIDNDPRITIGDASIVEGNSGATAMEFTVHLSTASDQDVTVNYSTAEGDTEWWGGGGYYYYYPDPPAATSDVDFAAVSDGTLVIPAGQTSGTIRVDVHGDRAAEPSEVFSVDLIPGPDGTVPDGHAVGTIIDDDPYASIAGGSVVEGHSGTRAVTFTVTLSAPSDMPVTVGYATADGTATAPGGDYQAKTDTLTFAPGETSKTLTVLVNGDRVGENDESFMVNLAGDAAAGIGNGTAYGTISDDEARLSIGSASVSEGHRGTKLMTFTVTLAAAYDQAVTVNYATQDGTAVAGSDYVAKSGTLTFAAGETSKTVTVSIKGDKQKEPDESFLVLLSGASTNALISNEYGWGTIVDDDRRNRGSRNR